MIKQVVLYEDRIQVMFPFMDEFEKTEKVLEWYGNRGQMGTIRTEVEDGGENWRFVSETFG